ncbi:MAG: o-succinylbenzoate synthase [Actinobacteria bacterium]|nr:o-succinylbenzoate synthase [Actinomycetota bacterium]
MHPRQTTVAAAVTVAGAFEIPLVTRFRNTGARQGLLVRGPSGWGEWSPFGDYGPQLAARWWRATLEAATGSWPPARRTAVPINAIVPAVDPAHAHRIVATSGCTTAKVKVGDAGDVDRVEAVRDALGPDGRLRVDVNGIWDLDTAIRRLRQLARFDLEYAEQPVADLADFARLRTRVDVPLAADESVRLAADPLHIRGIDAADVVILKVQPLGGVRPCLAVAEACDRPAVVSSAVETSVGLAAGLALAAALPDLPYACGLGTMSLLAGDVTTDPLRPVGGVLRVRRPSPDPALVERWTAGAAVRTELDRLLAAARQVVAGDGSAGRSNGQPG